MFGKFPLVCLGLPPQTQLIPQVCNPPFTSHRRYIFHVILLVLKALSSSSSLSTSSHINYHNLISSKLANPKVSPSSFSSLIWSVTHQLNEKVSSFYYICVNVSIKVSNDFIKIVVPRWWSFSNHCLDNYLVQSVNALSQFSWMPTLNRCKTPEWFFETLFGEAFKNFAKKPLAEREGSPPPLMESPLSFSGIFCPKRAKFDVFCIE